MRICGRTIRPSNLAERRLMLSYGVQTIRVPRGTNPFVVARRFARAARCQSADHLYLADVVQRSKPWNPKPSPEPDSSEPNGTDTPEAAEELRAAG